MDKRVTIFVDQEQSDGGYQYHGEGRRHTRDVLVEPDGSVLAHDPASGCYSRHHGLTVEQMDRARALAARGLSVEPEGEV